MTGARVLAIGGITSAILTFIGGLMDNPPIIGAAGGVMMIANVVVLCMSSERIKCDCGRG